MSNMVSFTCSYAADDFKVTVDLTESPYYMTLPSEMSLKYLPYYSTIDDPVVVDIANQLNNQLNGRREYFKVNVLMSFVQQNVRYSCDEERFGKDVWEIPIYVLRERKADCDGMTNLFVSIAYNMGMDVITVVVPRHMCPAVNAENCHGKSYVYRGTEYFHIETTSDIPAVGRFWNDSEEMYMCAPLKPTDEFKRKLMRYVDDHGNNKVNCQAVPKNRCESQNTKIR